jgi:hypothetical protein
VIIYRTFGNLYLFLLVGLSSKASLLNLSCGAGNLYKILPTRGQQSIEYTERSTNKYVYKYMYKLNFSFFNIIRNQIYLYKKKEKL